MSGDLLQTKLYVPRLRPSLVPRPHLIDRLNQGLHRSLTLISAPAGFGKTTLVSEWISAGDRPCAWLALDERDGDLSRFLIYFVAALQTVAGDVGARVLEALQSPQPPPTESILTTLLNDIAASPQELALVLDDYHILESPAVDQALAFLLEHLPPQLHLVMTTREDPPLPLPRLRARGLLTELRAADLRFTEEETAVFLQKVTGLALSAADVAALERRTEGWIAGLQLAALSMQGRDDVHSYITAFAGDNRYILDYLVEEVLQRQPPQVRQFLLHTSILERLSGDLCTAVTHQASSGDMLEALERGNLFVVPLDDRRQWYRYHHLFADVLQAYAQKEQPDEMRRLHLRASSWFEDNGQMSEAVQHALKAGDLERVAALAERAWPAMEHNRESNIWLRWVEHLPEEMIAARPVLAAACAWALLDVGELEAAEAQLQVVEQWLARAGQLPDSPQAYVDTAQFQALPATVAAARTYLALALGDLSATQTYARQALSLIPTEDHQRRGTPAALLGLATLASGDLDVAYDAFSAAMTSYQKAGNTLYAITGTFILADIRLAQGQLGEAHDIYDRSLQLAHAAGGAALRGTADLHLGLADLHREQNDLTVANEHLQKSEALYEQALLPRWRHRYCLVLARIKEAHGDLDGALALVEEAERHYLRGPVPDIRSLRALQARLWILQGSLAPARTWMREEQLVVTDELSYLREFDYLTLARLLIARGRVEQEARPLQEAQELLARLLAAAEAGGRRGSVLEIRIQQALAHAAQGNTAAALESLAHALALAEPEGYVRTFVDEGQPLEALLKQARAKGSGPQAYVSRLLAAFAGQSRDEARVVSAQPLVEPLSERELEVLQLVAEGFSNREIAERLYLALSTVKGHNRIIYDKLNVSRRTEAVARARELGLL